MTAPAARALTFVWRVLLATVAGFLYGYGAGLLAAIAFCGDCGLEAVGWLFIPTAVGTIAGLVVGVVRAGRHDSQP